MGMPKPIGQQGRWLDLLAEYDITIRQEEYMETVTHFPGTHVNRMVVRSVANVGDWFPELPSLQA